MSTHDIPAYMAQLGQAARAAATAMARAGTRAKNDTLLALARLLREQTRPCRRTTPATSPPRPPAWPRRWWTACA
jgi:hypothetical protein